MAKPTKSKTLPKASKVRLPLPAVVADAKKRKLPKPVRAGDARVLTPLTEKGTGADALIMDRLWQVVEQRRAAGDTDRSHSARLMARGTAKVAQKLGEEAVECVIEAALGNRDATVLESADLLYHLLVVWVDAGIRPEEVWSELVRRQDVSGLAEKAARPGGVIRAAGTRKLP
ncbi:MAG: phosphoribosyl-ATP diphosphatase [Rhodospirillales bacterium]|jgi:phosphoribosyl-ATP pyrophosphohydrolase|nr:phosphoribosyl-ATP diphosphatase [Rhodospirillales bacterium]